MPCTVLALALLTGCTGTAADDPIEAIPENSSESPSGTSNAPEKPQNEDLSEVERRVAALKDTDGNALHLAPAELTRAGFDAASAVVADGGVQPAECEGIAARNMGSGNQFTGEGAIGTGVADPWGSVLSAGLLEISAATTTAGDFTGTREQLKRCISFTSSKESTTTIDELDQDLIGDESYAVLITRELGPENLQYTLSVNARGNGLIASVQSVGDVEPDGVLQDELADMAAQLLGAPAP